MPELPAHIVPKRVELAAGADTRRVPNANRHGHDPSLLYLLLCLLLRSDKLSHDPGLANVHLLSDCPVPELAIPCIALRRQNAINAMANRLALMKHRCYLLKLVLASLQQ